MKKTFVGIDIGAISIAIVEMDIEKNILKKEYRFHEGKIRENLEDLLKDFIKENQIYCCTSSSSEFLENCKVYENIISIIEGAKFFYPDLRSILHVGGEKFYLFRFDTKGNYLDMKSNTSCAAGTGSFIDQQAKRLGLKNIAELSEIALQNYNEPPKIASRCSVFAKTDLIHAQQEGYTISEICDGICLGLVNNITDTLFINQPDFPLVFSGGVSKNKAVLRHLEKRLNHKIEVHQYSQYFGVIGAILLLISEEKENFINYNLIKIKNYNEKKEYYYKPLELKLSNYPDFTSFSSLVYEPNNNLPKVEIDIYQRFFKGNSYNCYVGIDIGSTSTKMILLDETEEPLAGFYTRTSGRPIEAIKALFSSLDYIIKENEIKITFLGVGTTGSGRKFIGKIINADLILDEITAHAKAAYKLNPEIDTIIEIGGQDAKFTTMKNGIVTFSKMNTVCAAGTGSFIEEQAQKLDVKLSEFSKLIEGQKSPLVSDRCTVFMERDISYFLSKNFSREECLTAVLFAVRENYLLKVAVEGAIGNNVCFQGATAKNKALVAAFEQKLKKTIFVSKYCHLTGAMGVALTLIEENVRKSKFRGIDIYKEEIPVRNEICNLCLNHCRIRIVNVNQEEIAFGFLCGRDYNSKKYIPKKDQESLLSLRKKAIISKDLNLPVLGIPTGLQIFDKIYFWKQFFNKLKIPFVTSEDFKDPISSGKKISGAEFCSPMSAYFGHVNYIADKSDVIFLPVYLEDRVEKENKNWLRKYCFYSQMSSSVASQIVEEKNKKFIMPIINYRKEENYIKKELYNSLFKIYGNYINFDSLSKSYDEVIEEYKNYKNRLKELFSFPINDEIKIVLLGRPYTVLSNVMNKNIPDLFTNQGVTVYYQDMLPLIDNDEEIDKLLEAFHWSYATMILKAANFCAKTKGIYPVLITSFKCAPDSFVIEYFNRILDKNNKPYLILQLDEHDSNVGYETRIEAAIRAFKNHLTQSERKFYTSNLKVNPELETNIKDKILVLPNWDPLTVRLLKEVLRNEAKDVLILEETPEKIVESMKTNTGQCVPINAIFNEFKDLIIKNNLNPEEVALWLPKSNWSCNIRLYPYYIKSLLESYGNGLEKASVYLGNMTQIEFGPNVSIKNYLAYLFSGILYKLGCRFRPYEKEKGSTNNAIEKGLKSFSSSLRGEISYKAAIEEVLNLFKNIEIYKDKIKPKVAIFGDLYVRDNPTFNQNLIKFIEDNGGEVVVTPYSEYAKITASAYFKLWMKELKITDIILYKALLYLVEFIDGKYYSPFINYIGKSASGKNKDIEKKLAMFNIFLEQEGETKDNLLKVFYLMEKYPDLSLFVHTSPAFFCPSLITEAYCKRIEEIFGVSVVNIIYDGTNSFKNDVIIPFLKYPRIYKNDVNFKNKNEDTNDIFLKFEKLFKKIIKIIK